MGAVPVVEVNRIIQGDVLKVLPTLPAESVHCVITSPPYYGLRDYGISGQLGLEDTLNEYLENMVAVFREVRRVLRGDGTLWLNIGDTYAGSWGGYAHGGTGQRQKHTECIGRPGSGKENRPPQSRAVLAGKNKMLVPWRLGIALQDDGWILRSSIIWSKPNAMPDSVEDRPGRSHEYILLLSKSRFYYYDGYPIREPVTGNAHAGRGKEGTPKAMAAPTGWNQDDGRHDTKQGRYPRSRSRAEYQGAFQGTPVADDRNARDVWMGPEAEEEESGRKSGYTDPSGGVREDGRRDDGRLEGERHAGLAAWDARGRHDQNQGHGARDVWHMPTKGYSGAHYATFPEALALKCMLAGTSEKGVCRSCGTQYRRITKRHYENPGNQETNGPRSVERQDESPVRAGVESLGWQKRCSCKTDDTRPAVVLDPFMGYGTTGVVAVKTFRSYLGVELNPKDVTAAGLRINEAEAPLFAGKVE